MPPPAQAERTLTWRDWVGFMAMVFGMFMAILDIQIVSASISEIQAGLSASPDEAAWVQTSYLIAEIVMIPLSGWLSRLLSTRVLFALSCAGFTLFSLACAFSTSLGAMIVFRAAQGFLGGAMIPTVFATTYLLFPPSRRTSMSVLIGLTATLAPTIGPTLGGWLTQALSWHWLFLINIPFGLAVVVVVWLLLDVDKPNYKLLRTFDSVGLALMATFLGSLEYVLEEGNRNDWFQDATIAWLSVTAAVAGALFFWRMLVRPDPLVDLRAFRNANFAAGCAFSLVLGLGLYGAVYVIPLFLGRVRAYNSMQIGETMFVTGLAMFIASPIAGRLSATLDKRRMLAAGLFMFGISLWWLAHLTNQSSFYEMLWPQALRGFSLMFIMLPTNQLALGTLPPQQLKNASGLYNLMRNLGGAIGLALINTIATSRAAIHTQHLDEQITWARPAAANMVNEMTWALTPGLGGNAQLAALKRMAMMVQREALTLSYNDVLLLMAAAFFCAIPLTLLLAKPAPVGGGGGAH
jgi:DHA2 family multidrug resistance protein